MSPSLVSGCGGSHGLLALLHGFDDVLVTGAAAHIAVKQRADLGLARAGVALHQIDGGEHHSGRTEAALQAVALLERGLHGVHAAVRRGQAFDGGDLAALGLHGQHGAGFDGAAIEQHGAGAALAGVAPHMGAGEVEVLAQRVHKQGVGGGVDAGRPAIDGELHGHRAVSWWGLAGKEQLPSSAPHLDRWLGTTLNPAGPLGDILNLKHAAPQRASTFLGATVTTVSSHTPDRSASIAQARHALLVQGLGVPPTGMEPWIVRSWRRCLQAGRSPQHPLAFDGVSAAALRRDHDEHASLLRAARPVLEHLTHATGGMGYFTLLTNARGVVLDVTGPVDHHDPRAHAIGRRGIDLSEASVGTAAIGAALTELHPVWLHRGEHFFDANGSYSCAGAPLFDPQGRCVGMLDLTGVDVPERPELRHVLARSARALEDALLRQQPYALLLRVNWPGAQLGSEADGLMALDADGYLLGCNSAARQLMPMPQQLPGTCLHCSDLLALDWPRLFDASTRGQRVDLPLWSGLRLQAMAVRQSAPGSAPAAANASLRETETEWIRSAVREARGNVAEAARSLGISRATVYRKLGTRKNG